MQIKDVRPIAIILEFIPLILIAYSASQPFSFFDLLHVPIVSTLIHTFFGWYLFKGKKFDGIEILITILSGIAFSIIVIGFIFKDLAWQGGIYIYYTGIGISLIILLYLLFRFVRNKNIHLEYRFSLKLASRIIKFLLISLVIIINY